MPPRKKRAAGSTSGPISDQLREIIIRRGLTAFSIARDAGIETSSVSRFLARERTLSLPTLDAIADALGLRLVEKGKGRGTAKPDLLPRERKEILKPAEVEPADEPAAGSTTSTTEAITPEPVAEPMSSLTSPESPCSAR